MNKNEFLTTLRERLNGLPEEDIIKSMDFYGEMIDDRVEDGMSEEEAVAALGSIEEILSQILSEVSLPKLVKEKVKPKRALKVWEIVLLILGAPLWIPILATILLTVLAIYLSVWSRGFYFFVIQIKACRRERIYQINVAKLLERHKLLHHLGDL